MNIPSSLKRAEEIILETDHQPFGYSAYIKGEKISDFVGRTQEIEEFRQYLYLIRDKGVSQAVKLEGPAGAGKSTLFNYIKQEIEKERVDKAQDIIFLTKDLDIFSTYFSLPEKVEGFRSLWKHMQEGLSPHIEEETGSSDIGFPEYVILRLIYRLYQLDNRGIGSILWENFEQIDTRYIDLKDITDQSIDNAEIIVPKLQEYFNENKKTIRLEVKVTIDSKVYEIKRSDTPTILNLFRTLDEDDEDQYYEKIHRADISEFPHDDDVISYYNDLIRLYSAISGKRMLLLLGIDEVVKHDNSMTPDFYIRLGNLFVRMRNNLSSILFVFISTTEDWAKYDETIIKHSDLKQQVNVFLKEMKLNQLTIEESTLVFQKRMARFWNNYASHCPSEFPFYPYTQSLFEYVLRYNSRNLRESIDFLNEMWTQFRLQRTVIINNSLLQSLKYVRNLKEEGVYVHKFRKFDWDIISNYFAGSPDNSSNTARSAAYERGIEQAWRCLSKQPETMITWVDNNPHIKLLDKTNRRPDVVVEILGQFGEEHKKRIEFQVKAYGGNHSIPADKIQSSIDLFNLGYTDLLYFITTGNFDSNSRFQLDQMARQYPTRIRRPILREDQKHRLQYLAIYREITGWNMGKLQEIDIANTKETLSYILGQDLDDFFDEVRRLTYREQSNDILEISEIRQTERIDEFFEDHMGSVDTESMEAKEKIIEATEIVKKRKMTSKKEEFRWLNDYQFLKSFTYETLATIAFLKEREGNIRLKGKFTLPTMRKNVIDGDASLEFNRFKEFVKVLEKNGLVTRMKTSYVLTDLGNEWYWKIRL